MSLKRWEMSCLWLIFGSSLCSNLWDGTSTFPRRVNVFLCARGLMKRIQGCFQVPLTARSSACWISEGLKCTFDVSPGSSSSSTGVEVTAGIGPCSRSSRRTSRTGPGAEGPAEGRAEAPAPAATSSSSSSSATITAETTGTIAGTTGASTIR